MDSRGDFAPDRWNLLIRFFRVRRILEKKFPSLRAQPVFKSTSQARAKEVRRSAPCIPTLSANGTMRDQPTEMCRSNLYAAAQCIGRCTKAWHRSHARGGWYETCGLRDPWLRAEAPARQSEGVLHHAPSTKRAGSAWGEGLEVIVPFRRGMPSSTVEGSLTPQRVYILRSLLALHHDQCSHS